MVNTGQSYSEQKFRDYFKKVGLPLLDSDFSVNFMLNTRDDGSEEIKSTGFTAENIVSITLPDIGFKFENSTKVLGLLDAELTPLNKLSMVFWKEVKVKDSGLEVFEKAYKTQFNAKTGTLRIGYNVGNLITLTVRRTSFDAVEIEGSESSNLKLFRFDFHDCAISTPKLKTLEAGSKKLLLISYDFSFTGYTINNRGANLDFSTTAQ